MRTVRIVPRPRPLRVGAVRRGSAVIHGRFRTKGLPVRSAWSVAVEVGFEPTEGLRPHTLSRRAPSATRRLHRRRAYSTTDPRGRRGLASIDGSDGGQGFRRWLRRRPAGFRGQDAGPGSGERPADEVGVLDEAGARVGADADDDALAGVDGDERSKFSGSPSASRQVSARPGRPTPCRRTPNCSVQNRGIGVKGGAVSGPSRSASAAAWPCSEAVIQCSTRRGIQSKIRLGPTGHVARATTDGTIAGGTAIHVDGVAGGPGEHAVGDVQSRALQPAHRGQRADGDHRGVGVDAAAVVEPDADADTGPRPVRLRVGGRPADRVVAEQQADPVAPVQMCHQPADLGADRPRHQRPAPADDGDVEASAAQAGRDLAADEAGADHGEVPRAVGKPAAEAAAVGHVAQCPDVGRTTAARRAGAGPRPRSRSPGRRTRPPRPARGAAACARRQAEHPRAQAPGRVGPVDGQLQVAEAACPGQQLFGQRGRVYGLCGSSPMNVIDPSKPRSRRRSAARSPAMPAPTTTTERGRRRARAGRRRRPAPVRTRCRGWARCLVISRPPPRLIACMGHSRAAWRTLAVGSAAGAA